MNIHTYPILPDALTYFVLRSHAPGALQSGAIRSSVRRLELEMLTPYLRPSQSIRLSLSPPLKRPLSPPKVASRSVDGDEPRYKPPAITISVNPNVRSTAFPRCRSNGQPISKRTS